MVRCDLSQIFGLITVRFQLKLNRSENILFYLRKMLLLLFAFSTIPPARHRQNSGFIFLVTFRRTGWVDALLKIIWKKMTFLKHFLLDMFLFLLMCNVLRSTDGGSDFPQDYLEMKLNTRGAKMAADLKSVMP